jgi:hypothetical protein
MPHARATAALLALALLAPAAAGAVGIEKGVKGGLNLASFRGEFADVADAKVKAGIVAGAFLAFDLAPDLAIQVEGLFSMKGAKLTSVGVDSEGNPGRAYESFVSLNYLEVPVLLRGTLLRTAAVQPMYYLGPTVGISLGGRFEADSPGVPGRDLTDLKPVDIGVALGAGVGFDLGGRRVLTEIRYTTGFADLYDLEGNLESVNQVLSLTAGLAF